MKKLLGNSAWIFMGQMITSLTAFIGMVVLARLLSEDQLGDYRFVISIVSILAITTLPGLDTALVRSTAKGFDGQMTKATLVKIRWGLWGSLSGFLIAGYFFWQTNYPVATSLVCASFLLPLYGSFFTYFFYLQGKGNFKDAALVNATGRVIFLIILYAGVLTNPTLAGATISFMIGVIACQYIGWYYTRRAHPSNNTAMDPDLQSYGKELTLLGAWNIVIVNIDKILVWFFLGPIAAATYAIATLIPLESIRIGRILSQALLPTFSQDKHPSINRSFWKKIVILELILIVIWGLFTVLSPYFFDLFFPNYSHVWPYASVALLIMLSAPAYVVRSLFTGQKNQSALRILLVWIPTTKTIILALGLLSHGLWGAIIAIACGGLLELVCALFIAYKKYNTPTCSQ